MNSKDPLIQVLESISLSLQRIADSLEKKQSSNPEDSYSEEFMEQIIASTELMASSDRLQPPTALVEFLNSKEIEIKAFSKEDTFHSVLDGLSLFMAEKYDSIEPLLGLLRKTQNKGLPFTLNLSKSPPQTISDICQLALRLFEISFLTQYKYHKSPRFLLEAEINRIPKAINFFTGDWFERFCFMKSISLIQETFPHYQYSFLKNPQITLPGGFDFELDLLFQIEGQEYWIECKTGDYQRYVQKYRDVASILGLPKENTFFVLLDIPEKVCDSMSHLFHMQVCNHSTFAKTFMETLDKQDKRKVLDIER